MSLRNCLKVSAVALLTVVSASAFAGQVIVTTAATARVATDGVDAMLEGNLVEQIDGEFYRFVDNRGDEMLVEIEEEAFEGLAFGPQDTVRVYGEIERGSDGVTYIDDTRIEVM